MLTIFMGIMPVEFGVCVFYALSCVKSRTTHQPAFWYALFCAGVLASELLRAGLILTGELPAHPKHLLLWVGELTPFGGFLYVIVTKYLRKVWDRYLNTR